MSKPIPMRTSAYTGIPEVNNPPNYSNRIRKNSYKNTLMVMNDENKENNRKNRLLAVDYLRTHLETPPKEREIPKPTDGWYSQRNNENPMDDTVQMVDTRWNSEKVNQTTIPNTGPKRDGPRKIIPSKHPNPRKNDEKQPTNVGRKVTNNYVPPNRNNKERIDYPMSPNVDHIIIPMQKRKEITKKRMNQILERDKNVQNATRKKTPPKNSNDHTVTQKNLEAPPQNSSRPKRKVVNRLTATKESLAATRDNTQTLLKKLENRRNFIKSVLQKEQKEQKEQIKSRRKTVKREPPKVNTQMQVNVGNHPSRKIVTKLTQEKINLIQEMQIRIATVLKLKIQKTQNAATKERLQKRFNDYQKNVKINCEYIIKDIISNSNWDIFTDILISDKYWKQLYLEYFKLDNFVITLIDKIEEIHDSYDLYFIKIMQFILKCMNLKYSILKNESGLENLLNDILSYLSKAYTLSMQKGSVIHTNMISMIKSIEFFDNKKDEPFHSDKLVDDQLTKILKNIMLLNMQDNTLLKYSYSVIYKIIKYKYINEDKDVFLEKNILYNEKLNLVEIKDVDNENNKKLIKLNDDILNYIKNKDKPTIHFSFFGLLNNFVCGNPEINVKNTSDNPIGLFISSSCGKINQLSKQNKMDELDNILINEGATFINDSYSSSEESSKSQKSSK